jgi:hypothetical protein
MIHKAHKQKFILFLLFLTSIFSFAQTKGVVQDSISGKPIPFVNIWVENENSGATSEEDGTFLINTSSKSKNLLFSALGFEKKKVKITDASVVKLKSIDYQLDEVVISKRFESKKREIGETDNTICQAFDNGPRIDVKYFPYQASYKKTRYIKQVSIYTDSRIENASIRIHFYGVDANGFPSEELLNKDMIVSVKKGTIINAFDITDYNLKFPKTGLFVGFEKLIIEKNKKEKTVTDLITNKTTIQKTYYPFVLYNRVDRASLFTFSGGKWNKQTKNDVSNTILIYEPAINLMLTN